MGVTVEPPTPTVAQYQQEEEEVEDDDGIVEVDPRDGNVKQELWIANTGEEEEDDYHIPNEQYEQELQAEDEQYIQAGAETQGQQYLAMFTPRPRDSTTSRIWPLPSTRFSRAV